MSKMTCLVLIIVNLIPSKFKLNTFCTRVNNYTYLVFPFFFFKYLFSDPVLFLLKTGEGHCSAAGTLQMDLGWAGARGP